MLCGLVGPPPIVTAILALSAAGLAVGVNVIAIVHVEFPATDSPHVPPVTAKSPAFGPLMLLLTNRTDEDRFVTVMSFVFVGVLAVSVPNASVAAGVTVAGMFSPVVNETLYGPSVSGLSRKPPPTRPARAPSRRQKTSPPICPVSSLLRLLDLDRAFQMRPQSQSLTRGPAPAD
jgi:hypothetical protein